jgi:hypothetical protein
MSIKPTIIWKKKNGPGHFAVLGTIRVGATERSITKGHLWTCSVILPGIAIGGAYRYHTNETDAQKIVELAINKWFAAIEPSLTVIKEAEEADD